MGEILKTGLICDEEFFRFVCKNQPEISKLDLSMLSRMIRRCCEIKAGVVERDPKEQGERALLNLGHTVGHAVEKMKNFQLLHGQCVGMFWQQQKKTKKWKPVILNLSLWTESVKVL